MFWHVSVCLSTPGGVPQPGLGRRGTPARFKWGWGGRGTTAGRYPCQRRRYPCLGELPLPGGTPPWVPPCQTWPGGYPDGGYPTLGTPPSGLAGGYPMGVGGYPTSGSTWYAAVGMPLAFTQEDFLVLAVTAHFTTVHKKSMFDSSTWWPLKHEQCTKLYKIPNAGMNK